MRTFIKTRRPALIAALVAAAMAFASCGSSGTTDDQPDATTSTASSTTIERGGGDTTLAVGSLPEDLAPLAGSFTKHIDVWGVNIVATETTDDAKILHAANVMAQYLDNDADGTPDNPAVVDAMVANRATLLMGATPDEFENLDQNAVFGFVGEGGQDLYGSETNPDSGFDASLEEVHHLILNTGWAHVFPDQLAQAKGSAIADAMDIARGGQFDTIPNPYPAEAWYTYDDQTCDYTCMITEYTYWAHTSLLGGQEGRANEIGNEWQLETPDKVRASDPAAAAILEDPTLELPTTLPDGRYQPATSNATVNAAAGDADTAAQRAITDLYQSSGNVEADSVLVVVQGGPITFLAGEEALDLLPGLDLDAVHMVSVHQVQTLDPQRFTAEDITFEQAQTATTETIEHLARVVDHFQKEGKQVYVFGSSYGAFVVQELLATQGNVANGYLIDVGRVDMPEAVWSVFARGEAVGFVNGTEIVEFSIEEAGMGSGSPAGDRNMARLAASLGMNRYSERLADIPLDNAIYLSGLQDEQVGRLTAEESAFLVGAGVDLVESAAGHETPTDVAAAAVARLLALEPRS